MKQYFPLIIAILFIVGCQPNSETSSTPMATPEKTDKKVILDLKEANRLANLPLDCIQNPLPYKTQWVTTGEEELVMPKEMHPAFYGCFDWHSAVHGHWSLVYLMKTFPELEKKEEAIQMLDQNLTKENLEKELAFFKRNKYTKSFERTYGWAWLLKLQEELYTWDHPKAKEWFENMKPLAEHISAAYQEYLPKLVYPIRVGEHTNTAFGLSFAYDYALTLEDEELTLSIRENALRFYKNDAGCPISWEPSGYDFLSPCLQELDIMRKVLAAAEFKEWSANFLPELHAQNMELEPGKVLDRADGKLVHLDGVNFSRAWCLYPIAENNNAYNIATEHLDYSLTKITDGDYAGQHWLASFALYAFKCQKENHE